MNITERKFLIKKLEEAKHEKLRELRVSLDFPLEVGKGKSKESWGGYIDCYTPEVEAMYHSKDFKVARNQKEFDKFGGFRTNINLLIEKANDKVRKETKKLLDQLENLDKLFSKEIERVEMQLYLRDVDGMKLFEEVMKSFESAINSFNK